MGWGGVGCSGEGWLEFPEMGLWGCAAGRGRIFITGLTIMW